MSPRVLLLGIVLIAGGSILVPLLNWRKLVFILMAWVLFQAEVRRLIPGHPPQVILVSDLVVCLIYVSYGIRKVIRLRVQPESLWLPPFFLPLVAFSLFCVVDVFNPASAGLILGLVGLHSYIWFAPLLWVGHEMFKDLKQLKEFCWWLVVATIPLTLLALYQHFFFGSLPPALMPLAHAHAVHTNVVHGVSENIRLAPSTFANGEKFSRYCLMTLLLSFGILVDGYGGPTKRALTAMGMVASFAGIFLSGRRSPFYFGIAGIVWLGILFFRRPGTRKCLYLIAAGSIIVTTFLGLSYASKRNAQYFVSSTSDISSRARNVWDDMEAGLQRAGLAGAGTGTDSQGMQYTPEGRALAARRTSFQSESGIGQIADELGIAGLGCFLLLWSSMAFGWVVNLRELYGLPGYPIGAALFVFFVLMIGWFAKGHQIFGDPITLIQLWFFMGVFFSLPSLSMKPACLPHEVIVRQPVASRRRQAPVYASKHS